MISTSRLGIDVTRTRPRAFAEPGYAAASLPLVRAGLEQRGRACAPGLPGVGAVSRRGDVTANGPHSGDAARLLTAQAYREKEGLHMPTDFPPRPKKARDFFVLFALLIGLSFFVIEIVDPASMSVEASSIAAP